MNRGAESWRIFCAVELSEDVRGQLHDHISVLREAVPQAVASWIRPENIHLTLKFFGNIAVDKLPTISAAAERATKEFSPFQIRIGGTGVFPRPSRPQVLWIGVDDPSGQLSTLQRRLDDECAIERFTKEDRAFRPHLTIARIRKPEGTRRLAEAHLQMKFNSVEVRLTELVVFRSEMSSKGSRYTPLSRHQL
jgi:2'-5' RNA ligase